eukprot:Nitzschia sp. Nitz4//scaffold101_size76361//9159//11339//NITZ4_005593-RA/size76361-processed-gene-0.18-mRNA-1//1//CDS//3329532131//6278//frame0
MASTILYKFQSGTTFEALPLPGSAARLFDVKKAIVKAKKLDNTGSMEFDLGVRNADTQEEYVNESMLLPRGTRLIVQRLPAARGHGFLARMARNEYAGVPGTAGAAGASASSVPSGFYTLESRGREDDEFVQSNSNAVGDDEKELAALQAATNMSTSGPAMTGGYVVPRPAGSGPPPRGPPGGPPSMGGGPGGPPKPGHVRHADPELREQEKQQMPKKRATGIPRTFLNLNAPPKTEANQEGEDNVPLLQPNAIGFKELVNRGGGQSENITGTRRDLDYVLKLTASTVPEHLQCGICNGVVKNAMLLPWDPEGRTACETCIRDALTQNGFRCPLTGMDGVSPDDLIANAGLRKAAELFIQSVMEKVDEIEKQQVEEAEVTMDVDAKTTEASVLDGDGVEKGVIVSKKMTLASKRGPNDDLLDGDTDFGGDVFAIETPKAKEELEDAEAETKKEDTSAPSTEEADAKKSKESDAATKPTEETEKAEATTPGTNPTALDAAPSSNTAVTEEKAPEQAPQPTTTQPEAPAPKRRERRRRGPPVGYAMGPAGARAVGGTGARMQVPPMDRGGPPPSPHNSENGGGGGGSHYGGGGSRGGDHGNHSSRGGYRGGRGGRDRGGNSRSDGDRYHRDHRDRGGDDDDNSSRGTKRSYDDHSRDGGSGGGHSSNKRPYDDRGGNYRGPPREFRGDDRGGRGGGGYRSGGGRGGGRGGRGNYRGGRGGGYGGRGRY